ncbi:pectinesterase/pectinesterase inhibitor ppe8b [Quercus suber]|uniref:Pectinesterase/pectinesterase inhibitor ppe8b n=1 Tax=Quercus suber TaxID=58331 RepID=A0AAW0L8E3_QUESU
MDRFGHYKTITDAIKIAPTIRSNILWSISRKLPITSDKWNIMMVGDGIDLTIISVDQSKATSWPTKESTTYVNMKFEKTAISKLKDAKLWHFYPSPTYQSFIIVALGYTRIPYVRTLIISSTMSAK